MSLLNEYIEKFEQLDKNEKRYEKCNIEFLERNLPIFECDNKVIEEIYYFRAYTFAKHIKKISTGKYIISEFLEDVPWALDTEGAISCPVCHHLNEARWFKDMWVYVEDYIEYMLNNLEVLLKYNNWFSYALYEYAEYTNKWEYAYSVIDKVIKYTDEFISRNTADCGMIKGTDNYDGMELSISSFGLRPTINSYAYANAYGVARILEKFNDNRAKKYVEYYEKLQKDINSKLYINDFYYSRPLNEGEKVDRFFPNFSNPTPDYNTKELIGYVPFCFPIPTNSNLECWKYIKDEKVFKQKYGLSTADISSKQYRYKFQHACLWNGPVWPFAMSQTIKALSNAIRDYDNKYVNGDDFYDVLNTYANSQYITIDGVKRPWIDENLDGDTGEWIAKKLIVEYGREDVGRGRDYNHSMYIDHIINGLCGVVVKNGKIEFNPILSNKIEYFKLSGVKVLDNVYSIKYIDGKYTVEMIGE